jgi:hypothetical protein
VGRVEAASLAMRPGLPGSAPQEHRQGRLPWTSHLPTGAIITVCVYHPDPHDTPFRIRGLFQRGETKAQGVQQPGYSYRQ